jgi:DNA-binding protein HU-beta
MATKAKKATAKKATSSASKATSPASSKKEKVAVEAPKKSRKLNKPKAASGAYTQTEFIENLQAYCGFTKKSQAKEFMVDFSELVTETLKKGYKIPLPGLGKMFVRKTKARVMPKPGEPEVKIKVPAKKKVRFTPAKSLKEAVL